MGDVDEEFFRAAVGSGAAASVVPTSWFQDVVARPTASSESGASCRAAGGQLVHGEGEKTIEVL
eukprot:261842-Pyramimonas_sp.AAC.1